VTLKPQEAGRNGSLLPRPPHRVAPHPPRLRHLFPRVKARGLEVVWLRFAWQPGRRIGCAGRWHRKPSAKGKEGLPATLGLPARGNFPCVSVAPSPWHLGGFAGFFAGFVWGGVQGAANHVPPVRQDLLGVRGVAGIHLAGEVGGHRVQVPPYFL
jgi:hypothetical protein